MDKRVLFGDIEELNTITFEEADVPKTYPKDKYGICNVEDSLAICINEIGKVDVRFMAYLSASSEDIVLTYHAGKNIIQKPYDYFCDRDEYGGWVLLSEYIKGNVKRLLDEAEKYNDFFGGRFEANITLLKEAMPPKPSFFDIHTKLGSSWIYQNYIGQFTKWLFKLSYTPRVYRANSKWKIKYAISPAAVLTNSIYGTSRISAVKILENILNAVTTKVRDEVLSDDGYGVKYVVNLKETMLAQTKAEVILEKFREWLEVNPDVMLALADAYYDMYAYATAKFSGKLLALSDINPEVTLYKHQKDAAMRIILNNNTVLCHDVGSGKTYCYVTAVHELYRMGISKKNLVTVPNMTLDGTVAIHKKLYPRDKLLVISPDDFKPGERKEIIDKIKYGDYTAIYIAYSKFDMISMSKKYYEEKFKAELEEANKGCLLARNPWERNTYSSKMKKIRKARDKFLEEYKSDDTGCFDELGITALIVDECQNYKNISLDTRLDNVVGMHSKGSKKADMLLDKVRHIQSVNGKVVFATGTLLTNSISDLFVFQTYLQPETLKGCQIATFGEWANTFGSSKMAFEIDVNAQNYRYVTRISRYHNLPELMALFSEVCDFYHISEEDMDLPHFNGYADVKVEATEHNLKYNKLIAERTDAIRDGDVSATEDNILKVITDGRKAALDMRIIDENIEISKDDSKAGACADKTLELYYKYPGTSQIVFCDYSTPKKSFNVYDEVKKYLVEGGIPKKEIAFIHEGTTEAKKNKLLSDLDEGRIRVMIGSTPKIGLGVNVQKHLIALHHLDAPWRPSDLTQREGRIIRQGNLNKEIYQFRYVTTKSFDSYVWQILENKQRFIGSFLAGSLSEFHRNEDEIDMVELDLAEVKALAVGNPLIRERIETANKLERARISKRQREKELYDLRQKLKGMPNKIKDNEYLLAVINSDISYYNEHKESIPRDERTAFGEELLDALRSNYYNENERLFDSYMSFDIVLPAYMDREKAYVIVRRTGGGTYTVDMKERTPVACTQAIDRTLGGLSKRYDNVVSGIEELKEQTILIEAEIKKGNPYSDEVEELSQRLSEIDKELELVKNSSKV